MRLPEVQVTQMRAEQHRADLFRNPGSYVAGVEDALAAVQRCVATSKRDVHVVSTAEPNRHAHGCCRSHDGMLRTTNREACRRCEEACRELIDAVA